MERLVDAVRHHDLGAPVLTDPFEERCRVLARMGTVAAVLAFLVAIVWLGVPGVGKYVPWQSTASAAAVSVAATGLVAAYRWEAFGGTVALMAGVALGVLAVVEYHPLLALAATLVFVVPAVLYLLAWHRTQALWTVIVLTLGIGALLAAGGVAAWGFYQQGFGATHPTSTAPVLPSSPVAWIWVGGVTSDGAVIVAEVPESDAVSLLVAEAAVPASAPDTTRTISPERSGTTFRFTVDGLAPATGYRYEVVVDGTADTVRTGTFTTFPAGPHSFVVAAGSCSRLGSNGAVYDAIVAASPDLFVVPGDWFYGDITADDTEVFRDAYRTTLAEPGQAALYRRVPVAYVWDDHDYGANNAEADSPSRAAALSIFRELVPHYPFGVDGSDAPIGQSFTIGRIRFILTDLRSARSPAAMADGPQKSMLGPQQKRWFDGELGDAAARGQLVVWVSSLPWIGPATEGADDWSGYAFERAELAGLIAAHDVELLMLAGDAHMVAIDDGSHSGYAGPGTGFPVFHAAALDRPGSVKGGPYSEGSYPGGGQFGLVEIVDEGGRDIEVKLTGLDWTGAELTSLTTTFTLGEVG